MGVPIAVWSAMFVADVITRKIYNEQSLFDSDGEYGKWNFKSIGLLIFGTMIGWGFVTNTFASWLSWQGYFLNLIGGKNGNWAGTNVGVIFALLIGFCGHLLLTRKKPR